MQELEHALLSLPPVSTKVTHSFPPGLYMRQVAIPAGTVITTMVCKVDFPFILLRGEMEILTEGVSGPAERITGPHSMVMKAGFKRVLTILTDVETVGVFANPDNETDPDEIGRRILEPMENPLVHDDDPHANRWRSDRLTGLSNPIQN